MMSQTNASLSNGRLVSGKVIDKINPKIDLNDFQKKGS